MESGSNFDSSRAELFEALGHPTRVRILRSLESGPTGFAQLKRDVGIESSGQLQFHLGKLGGLVTTDSEGSYALTDEGREAFRVLKTVSTDSGSPSIRRSTGGRSDWTKPLRVFQVVSVALLILVAVLGFAYYSQSTQVGSMNTQAQSLSSEVQTLQSEVSSASSQYSIANLGKSVVLADKLNVTSQCIGPHEGIGGEIVRFQANYSGYLIVTVSDLINNSKALPVLGLSNTPSYPRLNLPSTSGFYSIPFPTSTPISFTTTLPVSPPGYLNLRLIPVDTLDFCVTGANATGTFSVTYYY